MKIIGWCNCGKLLAGVVDQTVKSHILPDVPSAFFACHHFPCLSTMSRISPLANEISLGSSGFAVSRGDMNFNEKRHAKEYAYMHTELWPCIDIALLAAKVGRDW